MLASPIVGVSRSAITQSMATKQIKGSSKAVIVGKRVFLRKPMMTDWREFTASMKASRKLHAQWTRQPITKSAFEKYVRSGREREALERFLVCRKSDGAIAGNIHCNEIVRYAFHNSFLAYCAVAEYSGQGYMSEGLRLILRHAFTKLKLHRLEANIQPKNKASINLVKGCGFRKEGFSPKYLKIEGQWRDHERWAITVEDWRKRK